MNLTTNIFSENFGKFFKRISTSHKKKVMTIKYKYSKKLMDRRKNVKSDKKVCDS